jgi:hypothetical protein
MTDDDDDEVYFTEDDLWAWVAAAILVVRDKLTPPEDGSWVEWFHETVEPVRAAALLAEVRAMPPDERGMYIAAANGDHDA